MIKVGYVRGRSMVYSDFTLERVENELGVILETSGNLFGAIAPIPPSDRRIQTLDRLMPLALRVNSEKARAKSIYIPTAQYYLHTHRDKPKQSRRRRHRGH
jgi:hypothetical protein